MRVSYGEGPANHTGSESCIGDGNGDLLHPEYYSADALAILPEDWQTAAGQTPLHRTSTSEIDDLGRTVKSTDSAGRVTVTVYFDGQRVSGSATILSETRTYPVWTGTNATLPIQVSREVVYDLGGGQTSHYSESLTMKPSWVPKTDGMPTGAEAISNVVTLSRTFLNEAGQAIETRTYSSLSDGQGGTLAYTYSPNFGSAGTNYLSTGSTYDPRGRLAVSAGAAGTITHSFFDELSQVTAVWKGSDDVPESDLNSDGLIDLRDFRWQVAQDGTAPAGTSMYKIAGSTYDEEGNLVTSTQWADGSTSYTSTFVYDFRSRQTAGRGPDGMASLSTMNNLGETTESQTFADGDEDFVIDSGELRGKAESLYDELGRTYRTFVYEVNPATGEVLDRLASNMWYSERGMVMKTRDASGLFSKSAIDRLGRQTASYTSFDASESGYAAAGTIDGDTVIEQSKSIYDGRDLLVAGLSFQRHAGDTTTVGELTGANSYASSVVYWYDAAGRPTTSASYGHEKGTTRYVFATNGTIIDADADGIPDKAEGSAPSPNSSNNYIVQKTTYNSYGHRTTG